ncbi:MAG TPA: GntG family PLP-dependent aldolase [Candidatus Binatia bacterium]|nr:GntG family PLP-dependent aldolase [Candidatus Binatia bacterium]
MTRPVDLRSDLVSPPAEAVVQAMVRALAEPPAFGLREDPHQRALERRVAELTGHEDALLFPTCTMANQVAIHLHCAAGQALVAEASSHVLTSEAGGPAALSGVMVRSLAGEEGRMGLDELEAVLAEPPDPLRARAALVVLENTHNRAGGAVLPVEYHAAVAELARRYGAAVHLDGARLFNAAVALGCPASALGRLATTVAVSLNKGLAAPIGAVLAGPRALIERAVEVRQRFGGGIRPVGFLAAAGLVALDAMVERLAEDHRIAAGLAQELAALGLDARARTNIVLWRLGRSRPDPAAVAEALAARGVLALPFGAGRIRFVVHRGVGAAEVARVVAAVREVLGEGNGTQGDEQG